MKNIIDSVEKALENRNWYVALFVSLTLPDICVALEQGKATGDLYSDWFENNLPEYNGYLSGNDCYALRCALLHQGKDDITDQRKREVLEYYVFLVDGSHRILFKDLNVNGSTFSFLILNVVQFCKEICEAAKKWLENNQNFQDENTIKIHEDGYRLGDAIKIR